MKLSRRGFLSAVTVLPLGAGLPKPYGFDVHPYLREIMNRVDVGADPVREVSFFKGRAVGPTIGVLESAAHWALLNEQETKAPHGNGELFPFAAALPPATPEWIQSNVPSRRDIEQVLAELSRPGPRPDLIIIDGIGYGKDDPLPPPFGSGA